MPKMMSIEIPYEKKHLANAIEGIEWVKKSQSWRFPVRSLPHIAKLFPKYGVKHKKTLNAIEQHGMAMDAIRNGSVSSLAPDWLWEHQKKAFSYGMINKRFAFFMDCGTGKTAVLISLINTLKLRTIIVAPLALLEGAWAEDIAKFCPSMKYLVYQGPKRRKTWFKWKTGKYQVLIVNFETYRSDIKDIMSENVDCIVTDESSKLKNSQSKITKLITKHSQMVDRLYLMSGTPAPNSPLEYFPQMAALDTGIVGSNFYRFRERWGIMAKGFRRAGGTNKERAFQVWKFNNALLPTLTERLSKICFVVSKDECMDLPETIHTKIMIDMTSSQATAYNRMHDECVLTIKNEDIMAQQAIVKMMKLREITSGFIYDEDKNAHPIETRKDRELKNLMEYIGDHQVLIWCHFRYEIEKIKRLLTESDLNGKVKYTVTEAHGGVDNTTQTKNIKDFKAGKKQIMIGHPASIGHGLTLVNAKYAIYYSMSHSYELYAQSKDRIYRGGQKHKCQYFYLLCKNTIDTQIYSAVMGKKKVANSILEGI